MAKLLTNFPTNITEYPNSFKRQGAFPLEAYSIFYSMADAKAYAEDPNGVAYVGQNITVVTGEKAVNYTIQKNGVLEEIGVGGGTGGGAINVVDGTNLGAVILNDVNTNVASNRNATVSGSASTAGSTGWRILSYADEGGHNNGPYVVLDDPNNRFPEINTSKGNTDAYVFSVIFDKNGFDLYGTVLNSNRQANSVKVTLSEKIYGVLAGTIPSGDSTTDTFKLYHKTADIATDQSNAQPVYKEATGQTYSSLILNTVTGADVKPVDVTGPVELGVGATAEGLQTQALGMYSHTEGKDTTAVHNYSHAEGHNTLAGGWASHAEGSSTHAWSTGAHAEGENTFANASGAHAEGTGQNDLKYDPYVQASGFLDRYEFQITNDEESTYKQLAVSGPAAISRGAHAEGAQTLAWGYASHAEGFRTLAEGKASHAECMGTEAIRDYAHSEGYYTTSNSEAAHAEGVSTYAGGSGWKINQIYFNESDSDWQLLIDVADPDSRLCKYCAARWNGAPDTPPKFIASVTCSKKYDFRFIVQPESYKQSTDTEIQLRVTNNRRLPEELVSIPTDWQNVIQLFEYTEDLATTLINDPDVHYCVTGQDIKAIPGPIDLGHGAHAEGCETQSLGKASSTSGYQTTATGDYAKAEGYNTLAVGWAAHAEGASTHAHNTGSHAEGENTFANATGAHAEGTGKADTDKGTDVYLDRWAPVLAGGVQTPISGPWANGRGSHAEGAQTIAWGYAAHSEGFQTIAEGKASHAGGIGTVAESEAQTAIGTYNTRNSNALFAVGNGSSDSDRSNILEATADAVKVGKASTTTNVACVRNILIGTDTPDNSVGQNGDIYIKY